MLIFFFRKVLLNIHFLKFIFLKKTSQLKKNITFHYLFFKEIVISEFQNERKVQIGKNKVRFAMGKEK